MIFMYGLLELSAFSRLPIVAILELLCAKSNPLLLDGVVIQPWTVELISAVLRPAEFPENVPRTVFM